MFVFRVPLFLAIAKDNQKELVHVGGVCQFLRQTQV